ncbi:HPr family phosphocarrier protein [Candidatus Pacearchaeota archaeon]|nr:HPr family phosphocarrier protein [Candidatus Pacearchaeota archaeon]
MDEFFKGLKSAAEIVHKRYEGKPIDRALQKFLSTHMNGKKPSLELVVEDEHALECVVGFNRFFDEHKHLENLDKKMESMVEHLGEHPNVIETESIKDILKICLIGYDNRTIQIDNYEINPDEASEICQNYDISCVANYKHHLFGAKDAESWKRNIPFIDERMVIYAKEGAEALRLFKEISHYLGPIVAERKKYGSYASRTYIINCKKGLHTRSSQRLAELSIKDGGDVRLRTPSREIDGKRIIEVMALGLSKGKKVTISYRPKENADDFFSSLERLKDYTGEVIFSNHKKH